MTVSTAARLDEKPWRSARYQIETLSDYGSFVGLEKAWSELLERSGTWFPFATHEWMRTWFEHFGDAARLNVLLVRVGRKLVGIAPLMLKKGWMYGVPVTSLQSIHNVYTERYDFIIDGPAEEIYASIWEHLVRQDPRWDLLELRQLPAESATLAHLTRLAATDGLPAERWRSCESPYLALHGSWEAYRLTLSAKTRCNLSSRRGRLQKTGSLDVEVIEKTDQAGPALAEGWVLEGAAWKDEAGTAVRCLPRVRAFYEAFAEAAARRGWLRLYFLRAGGRRIAFCYALCYHDRVFRLKSGYDPDYASCSPSTMLTALMIKESLDRGLVQFEFLGGNDEWKHAWTRTAQAHEWMYIFRPGLRSSLIRWAKFRLAPALRGAGRAA